MERRRFRLLDVQRCAARRQTYDTGCAKRAMADVSAVADPRRVSGLRPDGTEQQFMGPVRRHQPLVADHRRGLRAERQHLRLLRECAAVPATRRAVRRDLGQQRLLPDARSGATPEPVGTARRVSGRPTEWVPSERVRRLTRSAPSPALGGAVHRGTAPPTVSSMVTKRTINWFESATGLSVRWTRGSMATAWPVWHTGA